MSGTLDDQYLPWLYGLVAEVRTRRGSRTYWDLFRKLYTTEFAWFVPNDDNREEDGRELRREWANQEGIDPDPDWLRLGCSFLELLIGISRRLCFEGEGEVSAWFWHLINNLGLTGYHDRSKFNESAVDDITFAVIWRTYEPDGKGGLFPLQNPSQDQREVEIWYQLSEYLLQP